MKKHVLLFFFSGDVLFGIFLGTFGLCVYMLHILIHHAYIYNYIYIIV